MMRTASEVMSDPNSDRWLRDSLTKLLCEDPNKALCLVVGLYEALIGELEIDSFGIDGLKLYRWKNYDV